MLISLQACQFANNAYYLNTNRCDINKYNCGIVHEPIHILIIIGICICICIIVVFGILKKYKCIYHKKKQNENTDNETYALVGIM